VERTIDPLPINDPFTHSLADIMADTGRNEGTRGLSATRWYASVGIVGCVSPRRTRGSMRVASSRVATVAIVLVGLAVLAVAGRLVRTAPSAERPATSAAVTIPPATTATTLDRVEVPDAYGQALAQAKTVMRAAGLRGTADDRDPQVPGAVVVVQEPAAGNLVLRDSVVWFRTRTDVQANGVVRRLRLGAGRTTATYPVVAPDPPTHQLTVVVTTPRAARIRVWLETEFKSRVPVVDGRQNPTGCQVPCIVRFGAINAGGELGIWTAKVAKHSSPPAMIEVTVRFDPL
jgi:PASTA domain